MHLMRGVSIPKAEGTDSFVQSYDFVCLQETHGVEADFVDMARTLMMVMKMMMAMMTVKSVGPTL